MSSNLLGSVVDKHRQGEITLPNVFWGAPKATRLQIAKRYSTNASNGATKKRKTTSVDVMHLTHIANWKNMQARSVCALRENGVTASVDTMQSPSIEELDSAITNRRIRVVLMHAFAVDVAWFIELAAAHPDVTFRAFTHSNENHCLAYSQVFNYVRQLLLASKALPNLRYGGSVDTTCWSNLGYDVDQWFWPCIVNDAYEVQSPPKNVTLLMTGRPDVIKAYPASLLAAAIVQKRSNCRVAISFRGHGGKIDQLELLADVTGQNIEMWEWVDYDAFMRRLEHATSIVVQPSMCETFNYVCWEAGYCGRPWVGSDAIRYTPHEWRADPNNPIDIVRCIESILSDYAACSRRARAIALRVAERNNRQYADVVTRWLNYH